MAGLNNGNGHGVTVIDGDAAWRRQIESWLEHVADYHCLGSYSGAEAVFPRLFHKEPHIVVAEIGPLAMTGAELIRKVKRRAPGVKVLAVSGLLTEEALFDALSAGADGFLHRRVSRSHFLAELRELSNGGWPLAVKARHLILKAMRRQIKIGTSPGTTRLSPREEEISQLILEGKSDQEIADDLHIALWTVRTHVKHIHRKLNAHCRFDIAMKLSGLKRG